MKVIIIDDEAVNIRGLKHFVNWQELGYEEPDSADGGIKGLEMLENNAYDMIIIDICMPDLSGLELLKKMRRKQRNQQADIVIISGFDEFEYAREAIQIGVCAYILKPINVDEVEEILRNCYAKRVRYQSERVESVANNYIEEHHPTKTIHPTIFKILRYIDKNYHKEISVSEISELFKMNASYLSALFKKEVGMTLSSYLLMIRMEQAKKLLLETNERVNNIAYSLGYQSPTYFAEQFKKYFGCSPSQIKRRNIQKELQSVNERRILS